MKLGRWIIELDERVVGEYGINAGATRVGAGEACEIRLEGSDLPEVAAVVSPDGTTGLPVTLYGEAGEVTDERRIEWGDTLVLGAYRLRRVRTETAQVSGTVPLTAGVPNASTARPLRLDLPTGPAIVPPGGAANLGRDDSNDFVLSVGAVSGFHCRIESRNDDWQVRDLGSTNGTFVDGVQVEVAALPERGRLRLADVEIPIRREGAEDGALPSFHGIVGRSAAMLNVFRQIEVVAALDNPVLVQGETGTGKELVAAALHEVSARARKPFIAKNCGGIAETLFDADLFGSVKGAFTGAEHRAGVFEAAEGGTIFLDEIGELPLLMQPKLLRAIQERKVARLGTQTEKLVDFRLVAATHRNLLDMARDGQFREDLYHRLAVFVIRVPPLRDRAEDIPLLAQHILRAAGPVRFSDAAMARLTAHPWPGNVRELHNVLLRASAFCDGGVIDAHDLQFDTAPGPILGAAGRAAKVPTAVPRTPASSWPRTPEHEQKIRAETMEAWEASGRSISGAARRLGIAKSTMAGRKTKFGLPAKGE